MREPSRVTAIGVKGRIKPGLGGATNSGLGEPNRKSPAAPLTEIVEISFDLRSQ